MALVRARHAVLLVAIAGAATESVVACSSDHPAGAGGGVIGDGSSWSVFDLTNANAPGGYIGAVFDGTYVYFVPRDEGVVARFRARTVAEPAPTPASFL